MGTYLLGIDIGTSACKVAVFEKNGHALAHPKLILSPHVVPGMWLLQGGTVGVGVYEDFQEAIDQTIVITRVQEPDMEAHAQYKKYMQMYLDLSSCTGM